MKDLYESIFRLIAEVVSNYPVENDREVIDAIVNVLRNMRGTK